MIPLDAATFARGLPETVDPLLVAAVGFGRDRRDVPAENLRRHHLQESVDANDDLATTLEPTPRRALAPRGPPHTLLGGSEEALQAVGRARDARIRVGVEQPTPVAVRDLHDVVDEAAGRRPATTARRLSFETVKVRTQDPLDLRRRTLTVQPVGDLSDDPHMPIQTTGDGSQLVQGLEGGPNLLDQRPATLLTLFFCTA